MERREKGGREWEKEGRNGGREREFFMAVARSSTLSS